MKTSLGSIDNPIEWQNIAPSWQQQITKSLAGNTCPDFLVYPQSQQELSEIVAQAKQSRLRLIACGSGTKLNWGGLVKNPNLIVSTLALNQVIERAVGDLTVTVEAGIKLADLQAMLQATNQFLPLDPAFPDSATIGGIISTADRGSWSQRYGGVRDLLLGLSFVRGDGKIAQAGGRVVKNVAGYDLMKLFTGSFGTLGIITQVTLRTYPLPEKSGTAVLTGAKSAIQAASQTLVTSSLTPTGADLLSKSVVEHLQLGKGMGLMVRFQSVAASVAEQLAAISDLAKNLGLQVKLYHDADEVELWQKSALLIYQPASDRAITCKIGVLPSTAVTVLDRQPGLGIIHVGSGLGKLQLSGEDPISEVEMTRSLIQVNQGFLTILAAPKTIKQQIDPWGYTGNALELMRKLKQQFDPENIFSPGRFVAGI
ncbi:FAD-binding oxidoreductase [Oscillatoria salina]|uniref:FAD-binding oxidoreductase n=1 Tax=Oscillatoria salina TaxID=331517 RepID=UPI0013BB6843|nr:FAD-binding oxidoreductase [Oscillatoria salina]MBZ8182160.1 FAD-binding oxidoreductase [Oscillatoria salina IIICB1]NET89125.1 FAD-binding oxidoreductase [Kamptonema sp. SIO1D9]